jgi:hypothetical protein
MLIAFASGQQPRVRIITKEQRRLRLVLLPDALDDFDNLPMHWRKIAYRVGISAITG